MKDKFKKEIFQNSIIIILLTILPFVIYSVVFYDNNWSLKTSSWSEFGDFIGGYGALIFGAGNLYLLIKVSYKLSEIEEKRNKQNIIDSAKPLGVVTNELSITEKYYSMRIDNFGNGPLIINNIHIEYNNHQYKDLRSLIDEIINQLNITPILKGIASNKIVIGSNQSCELIRITFDNDSNFNLTAEAINSKFESIVTEINSILLNYDCEDLFNNKVELLIK